MKKLIVSLLFVLMTLNALYSEEKSTAYDNNYWEGISTDILVKELLADAEKEGLKNFTAMVRGKAIAIIYRDIMFKPDSPELTNETKVKLKILVKILAKFAGKTFFIEGHTAKVVGQEALGLILSKKRADAVADFMANTDTFKGSKFLTKGYGDTQPVSLTNMVLNRRVEISIVDKLDENQPDNKKDENKNLWSKTLTDGQYPGYTVILIKDNNFNINDFIKLLKSKGLDEVYVYKIDEGFAIIYNKANFKFNSDEPDSKTVKDINQLNSLIKQFNDIYIKVGGSKDSEQDKATARQYNIAKLFSNNPSIKPGYIFYGFLGQPLEEKKPDNKYITSVNNFYLLTADKSVNLTAELHGGKPNEDKDLVWKSSDESILKIEGNGKTVKVIPVKAGECVVTVTYKDVKEPYIINIKVNEPVKTGQADNGQNKYITSDKNSYLFSTGKDKIINAKLVNGTPEEQPGLVWESSDETTVKIIGGGSSVIINALKQGVCSIKITHREAKDPFYIYIKVYDPEKTFSANRIIDSVDAFVIETNPIGRYREFSLAGLGMGFDLNLRIPVPETMPVLPRFRISLENNGLYHFPNTTSSVDSLWEYSWDIGLGYKFVVIPYFSFGLKTKYGGTIHIMSATLEGIGYVRGETYYNQSVSFEAEFEVLAKKINDKDKFSLSLFLNPGYRMFFAQDYLGHSIYVKTGVRFGFNSWK